MRLNFKTAIAMILLPTLIVSGGFAAYLTFRYAKKQQLKADPAYTIKAVVQRTYGPSLPTELLIELLGMSKDNPSNIFAVSSEQLKKRLLEYHVFSDVEVSKVLPDTLVVDYKLREPLVYLHNWSNTALSTDGVVIPFHPFYTPKKIPQVRITNELNWGDRDAEILELLPSLSKHFSNIDHSVEYIDLQRLKGPLKEIVVYCRYGKRKRWVRLLQPDLDSALKKFGQIQSLLHKWEEDNSCETSVIDLRIPNTAVYHGGV